jgi:hypothetical protein
MSEAKEPKNNRVVWPNCYESCEIAKVLGVSECENICSDKIWDESGWIEANTNTFRIHQYYLNQYPKRKLTYERTHDS